MLSQDIGMQFGIMKSGVVTLAKAKVTRTDVIKLSDGQETKDIDENEYTYLGIVEKEDLGEKK